MTRELKQKDPQGRNEADIGKDRLIREILKNAEAEAETVTAQAEKTKEQKIASAQGKADRMIKDAEERAAEKVRSIKELNESSIRIRRKRIKLQQSEEIIKYVFEQVEKRIAEKIGTKEYIRTLKSWAVEAILGIGTGEVVLAVSKQERSLLSEELLTEILRTAVEAGGGDVALSVSDVPEQDFGIYARSADGRLEYRNQVGKRLQRNESEYRKRIYSRLGIEGI